MAFYVYRLVDPRNGLPFYVGKGTGQRAWHHQREVERGLVGKTSRKVDRIREILIAGLDVEIQIVADYDSEADALDHEWRLVDAMPTLTNVAEGGGGGRSLTPAQLEKRRIARQKRLAAIREREHRIKRDASLLRIRSKFEGVLGSSQHKDEVEGWLAEKAEALLPRSLRGHKPQLATVPQEKKRIGLTEAKAQFRETGSMPAGLPSKLRSRMRHWAKRQLQTRAAVG